MNFSKYSMQTEIGFMTKFQNSQFSKFDLNNIFKTIIFCFCLKVFILSICLLNVSDNSINKERNFDKRCTSHGILPWN